MSEDINSGGNTATASPASSSPTTFAEAFAADASPASGTPEQQSDASAAVQPDAAQVSPQQQDERSPFIPRSRFDEVVTARKQAEHELQQLAWAKQVDQQQLSEAMQWYSRYKGDPLDFLNELANEISAHPEHGQRLRSFAAKTLAARQSGQTDDMPQPDVEITDGQGNVTGRAYSAQTQAAREQLLVKQILAQVEQRFQPVVKTVEQVQAERAQLQAQQEASQFATGFMSELSQLPGFNDHKQAIAQEIATMRLQSDNPAEVQAAAYRAYTKVVLPSLGQKAQSKLLDNLQQKAAASTSVNPGSAAPSTPKQYRSFHELPADAWK